MQAEEIRVLLSKERGQFLEFVSAFDRRRAATAPKRDEDLAREVARILSAMANADGGTVVVGVEADKSVTGIPFDSAELQTVIEAPHNLLRPELKPVCERVRLGNLHLLKFEVGSGLEIHRIAGGRSFYRLAAETVSLPAEQIHALRESKKSVFYERQQALNATWFDLARHALATSRAAGGPYAEVTPIGSSQWPTRAMRPANSRLDCSKFARDFAWRAPEWRRSVDNVVTRLAAAAPASAAVASP